MFVLLVEDDIDDQELFRQAFDEVENNVGLKIANNGKEAIEHLMNLPEKELPCLIIMDINMPVLDGIQTLKFLNSEKKFQSIPKVVFTTSDSIEYKRQSASHGALDYIVKPSEIRSLRSSIEKMINLCSL